MDKRTQVILPVTFWNKLLHFVLVTPCFVRKLTNQPSQPLHRSFSVRNGSGTSLNFNSRGDPGSSPSRVLRLDSPTPAAPDDRLKDPGALKPGDRSTAGRLVVGFGASSCWCGTTVEARQVEFEALLSGSGSCGKCETCRLGMYVCLEFLFWMLKLTKAVFRNYCIHIILHDSALNQRRQKLIKYIFGQVEVVWYQLVHFLPVLTHSFEHLGK